MDLEIKSYNLVASFTEERTYYLFTPEGRELSFVTSWKRNLKRIYCKEANHAETTVANHLYALNEIIN